MYIFCSLFLVSQKHNRLPWNYNETTETTEQSTLMYITLQHTKQYRPPWNYNETTETTERSTLMYITLQQNNTGLHGTIMKLQNDQP